MVQRDRKRHTLAEQEREDLWEAVLQRVETIRLENIAGRVNHGSSRSPALIHDANKAISCLFKVWQPDGTTRMHIIEARFDMRLNLTVKVESFTGNSEEFWLPRVDQFEQDPSRILVVNHKFYSLGAEARDSDGNLLPGGGFGGRRIEFQRVTWVGKIGAPGAYRHLGPVMATRNLWSGGVIPPIYWDRMPDNAVFLDDFDGPTLMP